MSSRLVWLVAKILGGIFLFIGNFFNDEIFEMGEFEMQNNYEEYFNFTAIVIDEDKCIACYNCELICPAGAITVGEKAKIDYAICRKCGQCVDICPNEAIYFKK